MIELCDDAEKDPIVNEDDSGNVVWSRGDICQAPWSGDQSRHAAIIVRLRHARPGEVWATVKYDGFGKSENEEVDTKLLLKPTIKTAELNRTGKKKDSNGGLFCPLTGIEEDHILQDKYAEWDQEESVDIAHRRKGENATTSVKTVTKGKQKASPRISQKRKSPVAVGRDVILQRKTAPVVLHDSQEAGPSSRDTEYQSPRGSINRGRSSKYLNSKEASSTSRSTENDRPEMRQSPKHSDNYTLLEAESDDDEEHYYEHKEKPSFLFPAPCAKVPYLLSAPGETPVIEVPATLNQFLRDYQRDGIQFMYRSYQNNVGVILGDDMGLGKTIQVIGLLSAILGKSGNELDLVKQMPLFIRKMSDTAEVRQAAESRCQPFLIIGPGCVLYNWLDELETWGYFSVGKYHGSEKSICLKEIHKGKYEIVVTTFETFRDNLKDLNEVKWEAVFVDEVHRIKGLKALTTQALRRIKTARRFGLTGTALQNNMSELWCLLDWARPGYLGSLFQFDHDFVKVIENGQRHDASKRELAEARKQKEKFALLRDKLMLRRTKKIIADQLPKKDDNIVFCKLSALQVSVYRAILDHPDMDLILNMSRSCECGSGSPQSRCCYRETKDGTRVKNAVFTYMHLLMKVANHVALLIPDDKTSKVQTIKAKEICKVAFKNHAHFVNQAHEASFRTLSDPQYCGKMKVLQGLLSVFQKQHGKVLLFSYSTKLLNILEQHAIARGYEYRRIDGATSSRRRLEIVQEYNRDSGIFICFVSTKAGGLGLNMTGANIVVLFDMNWNPSHDLQAQDRAYRIGQRRNVQVFRLVSAGTIEENIYLRQIYKQHLNHVAVETESARRYFHGVQGNKWQQGELFGIRNMFQLRTGDSCLTMDILQRNEKIEAGLKGFDIAKYVPSSREMQKDADEESISETIETSDASDDSSDSWFNDILDPNIADIPDGDNEINSEHSGIQKSESEIKDKNSDFSNTSKHVSLGPPEEKSKFLRTDPSDSDKSVKRKAVSQRRHGIKTELCGSKAVQNMRYKRIVIDDDIDTPKSKSKGNKAVNGRQGAKNGPGKDFDAEMYTTGVPSSTFVSVGDVFENCGVLHVHENPKVVGASRAEEHMSRCAMQDVFELHQYSQEPALLCDRISESSESSEEERPRPKPRGRKDAPDHNTPRNDVINHLKVLIGKTPKAIRKDQFAQMLAVVDEASQITLAERILTSSVSERLDLLNRFYESQHPELAQIHKLEEAKEDTKKTVKSSVKTKTPKSTPNDMMKKPKSGSKQKKSKKKVGVLFTIPDTESSEDLASLIVNEDSPAEIMDLGCKKSLRKSKTPIKLVKTRVRKVVLNKNSPPSTDIFKENSDVAGNLVRNKSTNNYKTAGLSDRKIVCTDDLYKEMAQDKSDEDNIVENNPSQCSHSSSPRKHFSAVDDIFFEPASNSKKRPPPSRKRCHGAFANISETSTEDDDLFMEKGSVQSTLIDNNLDCFSDPKKWKKRTKKVNNRTQQHVDQMISDSEKDYQDMFCSGKLRSKKKLPNTSSDTSNKLPQPRLYDSGSLFS